VKQLTVTLGSLLLAAAATAADRPVFRWSAEDLGTLDRIARTHERAQATAHAFCRDHLRGTRGVWLQRECVTAVVDEIVLSVDDQRLTAYARTGKVDEDLLARR
jgi:UrcA family protein